MSGSCHFGAEKCWFTHTNEEINIEVINQESPNFIARIFDMMEKFNERFELIENQLWNMRQGIRMKVILKRKDKIS